MDETLQYQTALQCSGLAPTSPRNHHPGGTQASNAITIKLDYSGGAYQVCYTDGAAVRIRYKIEGNNFTLVDFQRKNLSISEGFMIAKDPATRTGRRISDGSP